MAVVALALGAPDSHVEPCARAAASRSEALPLFCILHMFIQTCIYVCICVYICIYAWYMCACVFAFMLVFTNVMLRYAVYDTVAILGILGHDVGNSWS